MSKFNTNICTNDMTYQECELAILRKAVDESETTQGRRIATDKDVIKIIHILEEFLKRKKVICYGGTAINNILPRDDQFYDKDIEVPDYDFYSVNALSDAIELANIYHKNGYEEVEAKAGVHHGTYKVYVNFMAVADITHLHKVLFDELIKDSIKIAGIYYASPDFLRMGMYLELSRPQGDVSRWEKVHKRLGLLNKHYPLKTRSKCNTVEFQRRLNRDSTKNVEKKGKMDLKEIEAEVFTIVRDELISQDAIFFGGYACSLYSKYVKDYKHFVARVPDFDVLVDNPDRIALLINEELQVAGYKNIVLTEHAAIGEIVPRHVEIALGKEVLAFLYEPIACHNYNTITLDKNQTINVASIDTILTFYLAFLYAKKPYYSRDRLLCMAEFLYDVQEKNKLSQKGLLRRFSMTCFGKQPSLEDIRSEKARMYEELKNKKNSDEYQSWFLNYRPREKLVYPSHQLKTLDKEEIIKSPGVKTKTMSKASVKKRPNTTHKKRIIKKKGSYFF